MAFHVPKAPGFSQMLKEGAKVCFGVNLDYGICMYICLSSRLG